MSKQRFFVLSIGALVLVALNAFMSFCAKEQKPTDTTAPVVVADPQKAARLLEELASAITEVSGGALPKESFQEWYLPRIMEARQAGAEPLKIEVLILDRISNLAEEGRYCGEDLERINRQGPHALRLYLGGIRASLHTPPNKEK